MPICNLEGAKMKRILKLVISKVCILKVLKAVLSKPYINQCGKDTHYTVRSIATATDKSDVEGW